MMESKSKGSFALFLAALCLSAMPTVASAQTYNYSVYVDSDARPSTGCNEGPVAGSEVRLQVTASSGLAPQVLQVTRARCAGGAFVADGVIGGNYPVGTDNGTAGGDVIELSDSLGQFLIGGGSPSLHFSVVANSATGEDSLLSTDGSVGGPPITLGLPAIPIPVLGIPALILMAILIAIVGARVARRRGLWRVVALVFLTSGIALAANFVVDGQVGDWNGVSPLATDPAGDSTSGESAIDLRAFFAAIENNRVFMRIDVSNLQNNAPIAVAGSATLLEDEAIALNLTGTDNENDTLTFAIVNPPANGSLGAIVPGGPQSATVQYTPNADANGSDSFTFTVDDGQATSAPATISLTITPVNDVPVFTAGANQSVLEDAGTQSVAAWASNLSPGPANESGQALDFIVSNDNNALFSAQPAVSPTGVLTYTPAANANGTANVTVSLHDNGGTADGGVDTSASQVFTITVGSVNDVPAFTKGPDQSVTEGASAQTIDPWATGISAGPPDEATQTLSFTVSNNNNALFSAQPAVSPTGVLTYTAAATANGSAIVTLSLSDNGGTANGGIDTSAAQTFTITVTGINDAPSFTAGPNQTVLEDAGAQTVNPWATAISAGPPNESSQVVSFNITGNTNAALFSAPPAVSSSGVLTYTPAANANGTATITLVAVDDGGTANGGVDTSPAQSFDITVTSVNDAPGFTKGPDQNVAEDAGAQNVAVWATAISAGPADESAQTLTFNVTGNTNAALFSVAPAISSSGALSYTPAANANGSATITLTLSDNGGTANSGVDTSAAQTFVINVAAVNDAPSFIKGADQTVPEDAGAQTVNPWATAISAGPANESAQTLTFNVTGNTNAALFSAAPAISSSGVLTYTPAANASGTATISLTLSDNGGTAGGGIDTSPAQTFVITVSAVNDAPALDLNGPAAGTDFAATYTEGDPALAIVNPTGLTISDVDNANLASATVTISNPLDGALETLAATTGGTAITAAYAGGILSLTGSDTLANYQAVLRSVTYLNTSTAPNETARVINFVANDGAVNSNIAISTVSVVGVNTIPSFTAGPAVSVDEDAGAQTIAAWATAINDNDGGAQTLNFTVTPTGGSLGFSAAPAISPTGTLTFTTAANASGSATFNVVLTDNGSNNNTSAAQTLTITANSVNDAPSFVKGADQTVFEDAAAQSVIGWATAISSGPADESGQSLTFNITGNTNPALFAATPTVSATGTLSYTLAANADGTATISLTLSDNGGTANGGIDTSPVQTFVINVTAINDIPGFVKGADQAVLDNAGAVTVNPWATAISTGPANESGQSISFVIDSNSAPTAFAAGPSVSATGVLTYTPAIVPAGTTTATIVLHALDDGGTANGGVNVSATQSFVIAITHANVPPVLTNNPISYSTAGNTQLQVAGATIPGLVSISDAQSALAKSIPTDTDGPSAPSVVPASGTSANGGDFSIDAGGAFTYVPAPNFVGTDSFTYTVTDGNTPTPGTVVGTINIAVGPRVWYIDNETSVNNPAAGSDGRSNNAFETLAAAQAASGNGDILFVFNGLSATTPLSGGIVLKDGQRLWGEGFGLNVAPFGALVAAGTQPRINAGGTDAVSVPATAGNRTGVEIRGLDLQGNNAVDVTATGANNVGVTIAGNTVRGSTAEGFDVNFGSSGTQQVAIQNNAITAGGTGIDVTRTVGTATITAFDNNTIAGNTVGTGILVNGATFDATPGNPINQVNGGTTAVGVSGNGTGAGGVILSNVTGDLAFTDLDIFNDGGTGLGASSTGALNAAAGTGFRIAVGAGVGSISSSGGPAVDIGNASITLPFNNVQSVNSTTTGISLVNAFGGAGNTAFSATSGQIIDPAGASGTAFRVDGGNGNVSFPGAINSTSGNAVNVANRGSDTVTLSGAIAETGSGILLTTNTGATINFSGALTLSTGANSAFSATGGGTITATNTTSTATTTTATAINVTGTTIGAGGLNFRSISAGTPATGPANGIVLSGTGGSGGLTVSGTGSAGSGGTIQRTSNRGASFVNASNISLAQMNFTNTATSAGAPCGSAAVAGANTGCSAAIHLDTVSTVSLNGLNLTSSGQQGINGINVTGFTLSNSVLSGLGNGPDEDGLHFTNLFGTNAITATSITGSGDDNVNIQNLSGPASTITFTGGSFNAGTLGSGLLFGSRGAANMTVNITGVTVDNNFSGGVVADGFDNATLVLRLLSSTLSNNNDGVQVSANNGVSTFDINGNSFVGNDFLAVTLLKAAFSTTGTLEGAVRNNSPINIANGRTTDAISVFQAGAGALRAAITDNNIVYAGTQRAILVQAGQDGNGTIDTTITGNTIDVQLDSFNNAIAGILAQSAITGPGNTSALCFDLGGGGALSNTFTHSLGGVMAGGDVRVRQRNDGTVRLPGYAGGATNTGAVIAYLSSRNTLVSPPTATFDSTGFAGGAACAAPIIP